MRNSIHDLLRESKSGIHQRKGYHRSHPNEKHSGIDPGAYQPDEKSLERRQYIPELIKEVETYAGTCPDSASVAILHSMIAEMYNNYYMQNRWNVNQRTELAGYVPDDIQEWTSNLFREKIKQELTLSPTGLVAAQTPISQYNLILKKGKTRLNFALLYMISWLFGRSTYSRRINGMKM